MYNFYFDADVAPGTASATFGLFRPGTPDFLTFDVEAPAGVVAAVEFVRGDCDADGSYQLPDAFAALSLLFPTGGPNAPLCSDACDRNDDGAFDISDPVGILNDLFVTSTVPPAPYPDCGEDGTADAIGCDSYPACVLK